jgi:putative CocE/NonD family hydrolase
MRALRIDDLLDVSAETRKAFLSAGYAWIDVDVRGSGASSGTRPCPWWQDEIRDGAELVDWIIRQPWSSGAVGATGVSYAGTTAEFLLVNRHPAVRAIIPRFSLFDVYTDVAFPGGLHASWFTETWSRFNAFLDRNAHNEAVGLMASINLLALRDLRRSQDRQHAAAALGLASSEAAQRLIAAAARLTSRGVSPTDDDPKRTMRDAHIAEHRDNFSVHAGALRVDHRDDAGASAAHPDADVDTFSPHSYLDDISASGAAVYNYSGWLDGAYQHAAIKRHLNLPPGRSKLLLGPWDHGGRQNISPFEPRSRARFDHSAEMLRFFDHHLKGADNGIADEAPVRYFTMGAEQWRTAESWPPPHTSNISWYFRAGGSLSTTTPDLPGRDTYRVDPSAHTGHRSRWRSLIGLTVPLGYGDRADADTRLLCYTSAPLAADAEVTGHPIVCLHVRSTADDGAFFVYLEDVAPSGCVTYVTEGQLRALHRKLATGKTTYRSAVPFRSFRRADAEPLRRGADNELVFDLLPTSYLFRKGHAIRVAIAGADRNHFRAIPGAEAPEIQLLSGGSNASRIDLPIAG